MDRTWKAVWEADHVPGSFLWEWRDRAVADPFPKKLYDFDPATGIHLVKVKGRLRRYCNPRPTYYHVKMTYAPIKLDVDRVQKSADAVTVPAKNWYSFTNLSELKTTWRLIKDGEPVGEGDAKLDLPPRQKDDLRVPLPPDKLAAADAVELNFTHPDGRDIATYTLRLASETPDAPALALSPDVTFPRLNFVTVDWGRNALGWRSAERHPIRLINIKTSTSATPIDDAALYAMPLATVRELEADVADEKGEQVGRVSVKHDGKGSFAYKLTWTTKTPGDVQEIGWSFAAPASADRFSWKRQGYWSWYPADHIGRQRGTARPDSAKGSPTRMDRPDQFDFNSTKYDCDWATMLDESGRGIGATFDAKQRQHVRGDVGKDGRTASCCEPTGQPAAGSELGDRAGPVSEAGGRSGSVGDVSGRIGCAALTSSQQESRTMKLMNEYRTLGRTGLKVSPLGLGVMTYGWGADKQASRALFDLYREAGGNFFDTADMYSGGESETLLGEFVADAKVRDEAVIATKFSFNGQPGNPNAGGNGRKNIYRAIEGSLRRLKTITSICTTSTCGIA
jgi:hypothetical protein